MKTTSVLSLLLATCMCATAIPTLRPHLDPESMFRSDGEEDEQGVSECECDVDKDGKVQCECESEYKDSDAATDAINEIASALSFLSHLIVKFMDILINPQCHHKFTDIENGHNHHIPTKFPNNADDFDDEYVDHDRDICDEGSKKNTSHPSCRSFCFLVGASLRKFIKPSDLKKWRQEDYQQSTEPSYLKIWRQKEYQQPTKPSYLKRWRQKDYQQPTEPSYLKRWRQKDHQQPTEPSYLKRCRQKDQQQPTEPSYLKRWTQKDYQQPTEPSYLKRWRQKDYQQPTEPSYLNRWRQKDYQQPTEPSYLKRWTQKDDQQSTEQSCFFIDGGRKIIRSPQSSKLPKPYLRGILRRYLKTGKKSKY